MPAAPERSGGDAAGLAAATTLVALGALHGAWGLGAAWPCADRAALAAAVQGVGDERFPGPGPCFAVAAALLTAAALVSAQARLGTGAAQSVARPGAATVGAVLFCRGAVGLLRPRLLPAGDQAPFARLNTLVYSPLCLALAGAVARSLRSGR